MKSLIFKSIILLIIPFCATAQIKLEKRSLLNNKIELLVPDYFKPMTAEMAAINFPGPEQKPNVILTDQQANVTIVITLAPQFMTPQLMFKYEKEMKGAFETRHPDTRWIGDGIKIIGGKRIGHLQFVRNVANRKLFIDYTFTDLKSKLLVITFSCPEVLLPKWQDAADAIVASLKVL